MDRWIIVRANKAGAYLQNRGISVPAILGQVYMANILMVFLFLFAVWVNTKTYADVGFNTLLTVIWFVAPYQRWNDVKTFNRDIQSMDEESLFKKYFNRAGMSIIGYKYLRYFSICLSLIFSLLLIYPVAVIVLLVVVFWTSVCCEYADTIIPLKHVGKREKKSHMVPLLVPSK